MITTFKGLILELHSKDKTELNKETGVEKVVASYHKLHGFEYGEAYPRIVEIKLQPAQVAAARAMVGTQAEILIKEYRGEHEGKTYINYNFVSGHTIQNQKAA